MKITWLGHACFKLEEQGYAVVIDPYTGVDGYAPLVTSANEVLCSHGHGDHNHTEAVRIVKSGVASPFTVAKIASFHDGDGGKKRGENTIHLLKSASGLRIAHLGDLGHMPDDTTVEALSGCDALMLPVGGFFTIDAATARAVVGAVAPRVVLPMHYRLGPLGYPVIAELNDFLSLCDNVASYDDSSFKLTAETPPQTAVLKYDAGA